VGRRLLRVRLESGVELVALNAIVAGRATHDQAKDKLIEAMAAKR
jgi:hypothetical protein